MLRWTVAVVSTALLMTSCGTETEEPEALPTARYAIPSTTATPDDLTTAPALDVAGDTPEARAAFQQGLEAYCTAYAAETARAEEENPSPVAASVLRYARALARAAASTERLLDELSPPPDLAEPFATYVEKTQMLSTGRADIADSMAKTGRDRRSGVLVEEASEARWRLAAQLGAPACDGQLPPEQREAVVAALRTFETTPDSEAACGELATPAMLEANFPYAADRRQACVETREATRLGGGLAKSLEVRDVTGTEGVAATVTFVRVGGCMCGQEGVARLHLVDGRWRVVKF